jgi:aspartyl-tRNA(Asn)/glutamyl-tRNA(Gln) amidotransferase subunit A
MRTFSDIRQELANGSLTCKALVSEYLHSIDGQKNLNAFLDVFGTYADERAEEIDKKIKNNEAGSLAGMVVAIKDTICTQEGHTTCGSKILEHYSSPYDATVIAKLKTADAIVIGKTNLDEFAMGSSTENSAYGRVKLPQDPSRVPGGSSGGSAVAVCAGMSTTALGSDTGGSIRQPASLTGTVGLKPTYGRVSRYGLVAFASSFDCIGPFSLNIRDTASVLQIIAGYDPNDSTSANVPVPEYSKSLVGTVKGLKIGIPKEYFGSGLSSIVRKAIESKIAVLRSGGATLTEVSLPHSEYTIATYYILATAEASSNLARYDGVRYGHRTKEPASLVGMYSRSRSEGFGAEVKRRIMLGTYVLSSGYYDAYYAKAQKVRRLIQQDFLNAFNEVDCLITPTSPSAAFKAGEKTDDPLQMYLSDIYTTSANLAGIPAVSIPCGVDAEGLPLGIQVLGKHFDEPMILRVADFLETR